MGDFEHAFGQVSGLTFEHAACIAQRWEADAPFSLRTGESHVFEKLGKGAACMLATQGSFSGIWRAATGETFVTHQGGAILWRLHQGDEDWDVFNYEGTLSGVWGLDGHDLVFAWGLAPGGRRGAMLLRRADGSWQEIAAPEEPVLAMHGIHPDLIVAVGRGGSISRWSGQGWHPIASPAKGALGSVFVVGEDEIYACGTGSDFILAGALDGWEKLGPFDYPLHCVAKRFGQLWVGTGRSGLRRLDPGATELTPVKPAVVTYHFDARESLLLSGDAMFAATANGRDFVGQPIAAYVEMAGSFPPSWR